jgi:hypothetical protein
MKTLEQHTEYDAVPLGVASLLFFYPLSVLVMLFAYVQ